MNIFLILAALAVLAIGVATIGALIVIAFRARRRPWKVSLVRVGISLLPITAILVLFVWMFGPADLSRPTDLAQAYRTEFGVDPSADVRDIHARQIVVGDSGAAWLSFRASRSTIDNLLVRFVSTNRITFAEAGVGGNVPSWWKPDVDGIQVYYRADNWSRSFSRSVAYIGVDRERRVVYFHHSGSD